MSLLLYRVGNILVLWLFFMLVFSAFYGEDIDALRFRKFQEDTTWINAHPAGELVDGFHLSQPIVLKDSHVSQSEAQAHVCVRVLFATYMNRRNRGSVALRLTSPQRVSEQRIDVSTLADNAWKRVCFADVRYGDIEHGTSRLEIQALDSRPGKGVTAWISEQASGPNVSIRGQPSRSTLVHEVELQLDDRSYFYSAWGLVGFTAALLALLVHFQAPDRAPVRGRARGESPLA